MHTWNAFGLDQPLKMTDVYTIGLINGSNPANIYLFKSSNRNTRKSCEMCSKLTIKTAEQCSGVFYC